MFRSVIVAATQEAANVMEELADRSGEVARFRSLTSVPTDHELARLTNAYDLELLLLDLEAWPAATRLIERFRQTPNAMVIGFENPQKRWEASLAAAGLDSVVPARPHLLDFQAALRNAVHRVHHRPLDNLFAFLPAKAGSGASTTALNIAGVWAAEHQRKVLLWESDLHSGILSVLLRFSPGGSVTQALQQADSLTDVAFPSYVAHTADMDLLVRSGSHTGALPTWTQYHRLLQFVCRRYSAVVVDLPEVVNQATFEVVRRARWTVVVCTPELPSLNLARQRGDELRAKGVPAERVRLLVNRWHKNDIAPSEIEEFVGLRIADVLPNDYRAVHQAILDSRLVDRKASLGEAYARCSECLLRPEGATSARAAGVDRLGLLKTLRSRFLSA